MQMFRITSISHLKGKDNQAADALSRFTDSIVAIEDKTLVLPPVVVVLFNEETDISIEAILKDLQQQDEQLQIIL